MRLAVHHRSGARRGGAHRRRACGARAVSGARRRGDRGRRRQPRPHRRDRPPARRPGDRGAPRPRRADERRRRGRRAATCCCSCMPTRVLPPEADALVLAGPRHGTAGNGAASTCGSRAAARCCAVIAGFMNWRSLVTGIATGDQAMFVDPRGVRGGRRLSRHPADGGRRAVEAIQARQPAALPDRPRDRLRAALRRARRGPDGRC